MVGEVAQDIRVPHKGDIQGEVIDGACRVMAEFEGVQGSTHAMKALTLTNDEQHAFATAALQLRFEPATNAQGVIVPAPVTAEQMLNARRPEDLGASLWQTFNRVQENAERGGLRGRSANGRNRTTRELKGLDARLSLNRALWTLAEEMRKLKGSTWH